ncbi:MAG: class I SAM-dependent methyltransferase [Planctomycetes bacterium]|nr:class I SAM-dependent methyltransferase [Planctomycetota bacterium]
MPIPREREPEVMDTPDDASAYDAMDHERVNTRFVDDLLALGDVQGDLLDLGTGTARIPVLLCRRTEHCRVMAVDLSIAMLEIARYHVEASGMRDRVALAHVDAKRLPFADGMFAHVVSNSILHHVPEPRDVLAEASRVAAPGARLFFRDLSRPDTERELAELVALHAGSECAEGRALFAASLRAALTLPEIRERVHSLGYPSESVEPTSDRHWTWSAIKGM